MRPGMAYVEDWQEKYEALKVEKDAMEKEFGQKRAQFRQLYLDCEVSYKNEKALSQGYVKQIEDLERKLAAVGGDVEAIEMAAKMSEEAKHEEFVNLKIKHQEELASLQHIWQEASKDSQNRMAQEFEEERNKLLQANSKLEAKLREIYQSRHDDKSSGDGLMSMVSSAFAKRPVAQPPQKSSSKSTGSDPPLEHNLQAAQENAEAWRQVVSPLEQEIASLKAKLKDAYQKIKATESKGQVSQAELSESERRASHERLQEQVREVQSYLDAERSSRTDLEMYVAVLNTQKGVLQEDCDKLRRELHNVCRLLEQEKMDHRELKQTWSLANEQFLAQQEEMQFEINAMRRELSPPQLENLSREIRRHRTKQTEKPVTSSPSTSSNKSQTNLIRFDEADGSADRPLVGVKVAAQPRDQGSVVDSPKQQRRKNKKVDHDGSNQSLSGPNLGMSLSSTILDTFFPAALTAKHFGDMLREEEASMNEKPLLLSSSSDSEDDDLERAILRQNFERYGIEEAEEAGEGIREPSNLKKSSSSNDILSPTSRGSPSLVEKSLSQGDVSRATNADPHKTKSLEEDIERKFRVEETSWSSMVGEHALSQTCLMCQNYEKQLQRIQTEFMSVKEKEARFADNLKFANEQLSGEKERAAALAKTSSKMSEDTQSQLRVYLSQQQGLDKQWSEFHEQIEDFQREVLDDLKSLSEARDHLVAQCESLKEENENLRQSSGNMRSDADLSRILHGYSDVKGFPQESEEQLKSEIMFLKDRVKAEQFDRESVEKVLVQDLEEAKVEINKLRAELESHKELSTGQVLT